MNAKEFIQQWSKECGQGSDHEVLFIRKLREGGLNDEQIVVVLKSMNVVCNHCWDGPLQGMSRCYCCCED